MKKLLFISLLFISTNILADLPNEPELFWTPPTEFTDGSQLDPATDLENYRAICTGPVPQDFLISSTVVSYQFGFRELTAGDYGCRMRSVGIGGIESADSALVEFTVPARVPNGPATFGVR